MSINRYLELGKVNRLKAVRESEHGLIFASSEEKEVLLPNRYVTKDLKPGAVSELFLYTDSEDRIVATTDRPFAMLGEFAVMEVADVTRYGAFMRWGLPKDLFVPKSLQRTTLKRKEMHLIYVDYDERSHRLIGVQKYEKIFNRQPQKLKRNEEVTILFFDRSDLGYKVVVNGRYEGLVFHSEIFRPVKIGESAKGYVKKIRDDGKIDVLMRPIGKKSDELAAEKVMQMLKNSRGILPLNYKSSPETVSKMLGLSRKSFKRALTMLLEKGAIEVRENGTFLKKGSGK
ncbi:MAG: S1-like domain-containing RNA-binding protein [Hydrogenimonas sp.]|nr:S1-like domain-containing RNA-binding protein [Hydrogenimonas sp.]